MHPLSYYDAATETADRTELEAIQWRKLSRLLDIVFSRNDFYRRRYANHGVRREDIQSLADLSKLPFVSKADFQEDQEQNPFFGTNLSEPLTNYVFYQQTTGTTGKPLVWLDTRESWEWRGRCVAHALRAANVTAGDRLFLPFNFGPYTAFWGAYEAARLLGLLVIPGGGWDSLQRAQAIWRTGATVVATTPTYAIRLGEVAREHTLDLGNSPVRLVFLSGEPGGLVPHVREKIERLWGAQVYEYCGMTETGPYGFQCPHQPRALHIIESEFLVEVVDPETGRPVGEGEVGELVLTNLGRICSPAIRFRTGDLVRLKSEACACGRRFRLLDGGILGRRDQMVIVKGVNLFPSAVASVVEKFLEPGQEYRLEAYRRDGTDELAVILEEVGDQRKNAEITAAIASALHLQFNVRLPVTTVARGSLPRSCYKSGRFVDRRRQGNQPQKAATEG